jgi:hypothetical protein
MREFNIQLLDGKGVRYIRVQHVSKILKATSGKAPLIKVHKPSASS